MTNTSTDISDYGSRYILNREYFSECFDETANNTISPKTFGKAILFFIMAGACFAMGLEAYVAWFLLVLGVVELLSIRYKRSWWITRQMLGRAAGSKVNLRIDDQGIFTDGAAHQQSMFWSDITNIAKTEKGFVVTHGGGAHYLSKSGIDQNVLELLANKAVVLAEQN